MGQVLHRSATTTEAIRRAIQHSQESMRALARRHVILAFWFGPATAVKFGPLGRHWLGFMDGATEA